MPRELPTLSDLPSVLVAQALEFADLHTLLGIECVSSSLQQLVRDFHLWRELMSNTTCITERSCHNHNSASRWKRLVLLAALPAQKGLHLLDGVRDCSSVDNPGECPENTLTRSPCEVEVGYLARTDLAQEPLLLLEWAQRVQLKCGCARGQPCYWSTAASWKHASRDFIEYTLIPESIVSSVRVAPYRVYWYPGNPTYSPVQLSFSFHELVQTERDPDSADAGVRDCRPGAGKLGPAVYESPVYEAIGDMKLQEFELPRRVFLNRGVLRLNLFDRQQDLGAEMMEWHRENSLPPFYICLSHVGATGRCVDAMEEGDAEDRGG